MTDSLEVVLSFADSFGRRAFLSLKTNSLSFSLFINPFFFFSFFFALNFQQLYLPKTRIPFLGSSLSLSVSYLSAPTQRRGKNKYATVRIFIFQIHFWDLSSKYVKAELKGLESNCGKNSSFFSIPKISISCCCCCFFVFGGALYNLIWPFRLVLFWNYFTCNFYRI